MTTLCGQHGCVCLRGAFITLYHLTLLFALESWRMSDLFMMASAWGVYHAHCVTSVGCPNMTLRALKLSGLWFTVNACAILAQNFRCERKARASSYSGSSSESSRVGRGIIDGCPSRRGADRLEMRWFHEKVYGVYSMRSRPSIVTLRDTRHRQNTLECITTHSAAVSAFRPPPHSRPSSEPSSSCYCSPTSRF